MRDPSPKRLTRQDKGRLVPQDLRDHWKERIRVLGLTQAKVCQDLGWHSERLGRMLCGRSRSSQDSFQTLNRYLGAEP